MAGGRPKGAHEIAPKVRKAFLKAIENLKAGGGITDMADIFQEMITQDPFKAFDVLAKFTPKEVVADIQEQKTVYYVAMPAIAQDKDEWFLEHKQSTESLTKQ